MAAELPFDGNELPQHAAGRGVLWPSFVLRVAASSVATVAAGGTQINLVREQAFIMTTGVMSGLELGLKGGSADQYIPIFHTSIFELNDKHLWLAQRVATADGAVTILGFACEADALLWKQRLQAVPQQQGAAVPVTVDVSELPAATLIADNDPVPTTSRIGANLLAYDGATFDMVRSVSTDAVNPAPPTVGAIPVAAWMVGFTTEGAGNTGRKVLVTDGGSAIANSNLLHALASVYGVNSGGTLDQVTAAGDNADSIATATLGALKVLARGSVLNDVKAQWDRLRQPDSYRLGSDVMNAQSLAIAAQGVILTTGVLSQDAIIQSARLNVQSGTPTGAVLEVELVRAAVTYTLYVTLLGAGSTNVELFPSPFHALSGDTVRVSLTIGTAVACTADGNLSWKAERFDFS